jgi:tetratricopeptide (TPR) repeat protein
MTVSKLSISILALVLSAGLAHADRNKDKADALFKQGKRLMADKRYADACAAFEQSQKLDPGIGTQLNVAKCYEDWGKLARAYKAYAAALALAKETKDGRAPKIEQLIDKLDGSVPRLTVRTPKNAETRGLQVTIDGTALTAAELGQPLMVDPGPHAIEYALGSGARKSKIVPVERGGSSEITLDLPPAKAKHPDDTDPDPNDDPVEGPAQPGRGQRIGGLALGGAGVVAIGISTAMALSAKGRYNDALDMHCMGMKDACDPTGLMLTADARSSANVATVVFLVGAAAVGGGVALYLLAPKGDASGAERAVYLVPTIGPDGGGIVLGGRL